VAVSFDVPDPTEVATFWAGVLGRTGVIEPGGVLLPGDDTQIGLRFVAAKPVDAAPRRLHLHLTSASVDDQRHTVDAALRLGAYHLDVGQPADEPYVVLADPAGNAFCVIEPGNKFLAGCGRLGEVTCEGTRTVGLFWRDVLAWPLVWDRDEETAVQSPQGGTKLSWGGQPAAPKQGGNRQRFNLAAADPKAEVPRLVALGASALGDHDGVIELADPDGNEFSISPAG
jgi:hypothetical protein